jgi:AcrR family transcriptional regulator
MVIGALRFGAMSTESGLRERKRIAAMRRIQEVALDLFDSRGFDKVTIEQIARAAEVSTSSVYRYFGTKEQLVLHDEFDLQLLEAVQRELASHTPVDAVRRAISTLMKQFFGRDEELARRKIRYWAEEPAIQAAAAEQSDQFAQAVADALAQAAGRQPGDLDVQVIAATLVWAMIAAARHWYASGSANPLEEELQRALTLVENGLRLDSG